MNQQAAFSSLFAPEARLPQRTMNRDFWKVLLVDDEPDIHNVLHLVLKNVEIEGRSLQLLDASSMEEAKNLMSEHPDIALILLDVVMEAEQAGLELVRFIRSKLDNRTVQIVLVTGQPGYAPQHEVVTNYEINGYLLKSELIADKIFVSVYAALRTYHIMRNSDLLIQQLKSQEAIMQSQQDKLAEQMEVRTRDLTDKEVLLKEIHHRVKNNLQVISSMVGLQADGSEDEAVRQVLRDVIYRVRSMALVHEKLYQSADLAHVDFAEYTRGLLSYLCRAHGDIVAAVRLTFNLEPVLLPVDKAVPCGLILNELAVNALKHAFQGRADGEVTVSLQSGTDGRIHLCVADNGIGLPAGFDWRQTRSLGLRLVQMLSKQLDSTVEVSSGYGTKFEMVFAYPDSSLS